LTVVDGSADVECSVVSGYCRWDESGLVSVGDVKEDISSAVVVDEVEADIG